MQDQLENVKERNTTIWEILLFPERCIGCMSCVRSCMKKARIAKVNPIVKMIMKRFFRQA